MTCIKFMPYTGDLMGLPTNENHINFLWCEPGCKVLFSVTRQGRAASCHFASDKSGMRKIKKAIKEWCKFVFELFEWCSVIIAKVEINRVKSLIKTFGFVKVWGSNTNKSIYALERC